MTTVAPHRTQAMDESLKTLEVSKWEEELAKVLPVRSPEGRIARRGAVRAAVKAGDRARAAHLANAFRSEPGAPPTLKRALSQLVPATERTLVATGSR
jgi:hypothetical protein